MQLARHDDEARFVGMMIGDVLGHDLEAVEPGGQRAGNHAHAARRVEHQPPGRAGRVVIGVGRDAVPRQELPALHERLRMRPDRPDLAERRAGQGHEALPERQAHLADDRERRADQQVGDLVDGAPERVLDGHDAPVEGARGDAVEDLGEAAAGHRHQRRVEAVEGHLAPGAVLALEGAEARPAGLQPLALVDDRGVEPLDEVLADEPAGRGPHAAAHVRLAALVGHGGLQARRLQRVLDALVEQPEELAVGVVDLRPELCQARPAGLPGVLRRSCGVVHASTIPRRPDRPLIIFSNVVFMIMNCRNVRGFRYK